MTMREELIAQARSLLKDGAPERAVEALADRARLLAQHTCEAGCPIEQHWPAVVAYATDDSGAIGGIACHLLHKVERLEEENRLLRDRLDDLAKADAERAGPVDAASGPA